MKYVALLSGGKDSCFNLLHCQRNGHELVAAATMSPVSGKEEIDSYLYQTVGQDAIELVAEALDVPLYRGIIKGTAVDQRSEYGSREPGKLEGVEGDETEDLFELLCTVKARHPDISGVSVGAILSSYQRVRVEHVCQRLSLTSLSYLWQRDQDELLSEMISSGLHAIIIKVAGIGLTPKHLGKTLAEMQPTLQRLNQQYGAHICGEGGEYETLTLDCPLFKRKIVLQECETVIHSDSDFATVAYLRIKRAHLSEKDQTQFDPIQPPNMLSEKFEDIYSNLTDIAEVPLHESEQRLQEHTGQLVPFPGPTSFRTGSWITITNVFSQLDSCTDIEEETHACFQILQENLLSNSISISQVALMTVYVSDMDLFSRINKVYAEHFGMNPPSRACVAVNLPPNVNVKIDCLAHSGDQSDRKALHVQGLSYWAPANIGPYSQAVSTGDQIFISGQIGMQPSDLSMPKPLSFRLEAALSFQHAARVVSLVKDMFGSSWAPASQLVICWLTDRSLASNLRGIKSNRLITSAPFLMVGAKALPKGALIETQVFAHTGRYVTVDLGIEEYNKCAPPKLQSGNCMHGSCRLSWQRSQFEEIRASAFTLTVKGFSSEELDLSRVFGETCAIDNVFLLSVFFTPFAFSFAKTFLDRYLDSKPASFIPVQFVSTFAEDDWDFSICGLMQGS